MKHFPCWVAGLLIGMAPTAFGAGSNDLNLTVRRPCQNEKGTSGCLQINGTNLCDILERAGADQLQNISSIPTGTYSGVLYYEHPDHWRMELKEVLNPTTVQIHFGSQPDQGKGCLLVGKPGQHPFAESAEVLKDIKKAFYGTESPAAAPDMNVSVQIIDGAPTLLPPTNLRIMLETNTNATPDPPRNLRLAPPANLRLGGDG